MAPQSGGVLCSVLENAVWMGARDVHVLVLLLLVGQRIHFGEAGDFPFSKAVFLLKGLYLQWKSTNYSAFLQLICKVLGVLC